MKQRARSPKDGVLPGPLTEHAAGFAAELHRQGFTPLSVVHQLRLAAHLSRWMQDRSVDLGQLTADWVDEFLVERRTTHTNRYSHRSLRPLLGFLNELGVLPAEAPAAPTHIELVVAGFERYQVNERGLLPRTAAAQASRVHPVPDPILPTGRTRGSVGSRCHRRIACRGHQPRRLLGQTTGLYAAVVPALRLPERTDRPRLVRGVDSDPGAPAVVVPIGISRQQTTSLLAACDRNSVVGRRDYAVILLLARLGLRATEVAQLHLDDLDWHHGEITVRGKGPRDERMPLPADVGEALVDYLMRSRPTDAPELRTVFLAAPAPRRPMDRVTVSSMIGRVCQHAGIEPIGAHLLRRTLGEAMIRAEVPLSAISQVLRHHDPLTTTNYARVDIERLRGLARPWPGETPTNASGDSR